MRLNYLCVAALATLMITQGGARADIVTGTYGDDDGFGIGATSGPFPGGNPFGFNGSDPGEAPFTDIGLIADGFSDPAFRPTGSFSSFMIPSGAEITGATLSARFGSFDPIPPLQPPNQIVLDGVTIDPAFFDLFADKTGAFGDASNDIETVSFALDPALFPLFADGMVNLTGTQITEASGSGSFVVDFLQLDVEFEQQVPEPATLTIFGLGVIGMAGAAIRRRRKQAA